MSYMCYILRSVDDGLQEVDIGALRLWKIGIAVLSEEGMHLLLALELLHQVMDIDLLQLWLVHAMCYMDVRCLILQSMILKQGKALHKDS